MAIETKKTYSGQNSTSTLAGDIRLEEGRGRLVIYDPITKQERQVHDINGSRYNDIQGREMTRVNILGLTTMEPSTGVYRNRVGIAEGDGRTIIATSKPGIDLRNKGI